MGITCKPIGKVKRITKKMENQLEKERQELANKSRKQRGKNKENEESK